MKKPKNSDINPRLGQIVDPQKYLDALDGLKLITEQVVSLNQQLDVFYHQTNTDEELFEEDSIPKVSLEVYERYAELRHERDKLWPLHQYLQGYTDLTLKINELLDKRDFDYCVKYFEKKNQEIMEKVQSEQVTRAMSDATQDYIIENFVEFRDNPKKEFNSKKAIKNINASIVEHLVEDYEWSKENALALIKSTNNK